MATAIGAVERQARERRIFTGMAALVAVTVVGGFGSFALRGYVDVASVPWWVHVHALSLLAWTLLFLAQALLVAQRRTDLHRQLGWVAAGLACFLIPWGIATSILAVQMGRVPPFFPPGIFLVLGPLDMLAFGSLTLAAILLRQRSDWHKRLILCGTIAMMEPAFGRILPMPLLGPWAGTCATLMQLLYVGIAMRADAGLRGAVHPAYRWGLAVIAGRLLLVELLGRTAIMSGAAAALAAG
ncbi:hypothetical protein GS397_14630 [Sphingobium yanoikuyae]|uniref:DUF2306 domain-containing protein n=1 Tax=Sphingobium yanoikuyae TaxID=13690 RepID=A0A6P1GI83_SPHYA|nr:hypothetical protein [Sphingobium yanoikuyae]QHD68159.1 hypothetical protein GS397_14630 [Sphingobium yanoikuyae]